MMLKYRSYQKELLDGDNIPFEDIKENMEELNIINTLLGGHAITLQGFEELVSNHKKITVCEIGCGGGDNLVAIAKWCLQHHIEVTCIGIDLKIECIEVASKRPELKGISSWIAHDYAGIKFDSKPGIIFSSLFCHHFTDEELVRQLQWMQENSTIGFFINDLQRSLVAYLSISILTQLFSSSYLVKHDAPVSVSRGFLKNEWVNLCKLAGIRHSQIQWKWAFRHLIICPHEPS